jgi:hypothetical protein
MLNDIQPCAHIDHEYQRKGRHQQYAGIFMEHSLTMVTVMTVTTAVTVVMTVTVVRQRQPSMPKPDHATTKFNVTQLLCLQSYSGKRWLEPLYPAIDWDANIARICSYGGQQHVLMCVHPSIRLWQFSALLPGNSYRKRLWEAQKFPWVLVVKHQEYL